MFFLFVVDLFNLPVCRYLLCLFHWCNVPVGIVTDLPMLFMYVLIEGFELFTSMISEQKKYS